VGFSGSPQTLKDKYVFYQLYDTIKAVAQTFANVDRYILQGTAKGQTSSSLQLGAYNVPPGSVVVTAGGQTLKENVDYIVDYNLGTVQVINQAILNSGVPVNVSYENNASFGLQQRSFLGVRFDYLMKNTPTETLNIGGTIERLKERPFFSKMNYGEDPISNTMYGVDVNYRGQLPQLTRALDKLPFYTTKEMSTINAYGEAAILKPGHPAQIGKGSSGAVYIDDFEGSTSSIDLRFPLTSWALASTPQNNGLFPEGSLKDSLDYGFNRAKLAWYNIEPTLQDKSASNNPVSYQDARLDPRIAPLNVTDLFPEQTPQTGQAQLITFDMAYYPTERGPYNYDARPGSIDGTTGKLLNPQKRWGGIMRAIDQTDFETNNIEVLQFWIQSPFLTNPNTKGQLYFDLGSVSEDILRDGKKEFENGLNTPNINAAIDNTSVWGRVPANPIQVTTAFSNDASDRPYQDVGLDGMTDSQEVSKFQPYLNKLSTQFGQNSPAYQNASTDPSSDNFINYRDSRYDAAKVGILGRYKNVNNPQGNSPVATAGSTTLTAYTLYPDQEDLNKDNTMNELEEYFEYKLEVRSDSLRMGGRFVTDSMTFKPSNGGVTQTWYQVRIPISEYYQKVGNIPDFKSIQFIRMYLTGFSDSVVCRFAKLELVRNSWRSFDYVIDTTGNYTLLPTTSLTTFNVTAVNIEQNSSRTPINYVSPPGVTRQQELSNNNVNLLLNEQAMSLQICNLKQGDVRGVYKTTALDLRRYGTMDMYVHAEGTGSNTAINDNDLDAIVRIGSDFVSNYYEIRIPLKRSNWNISIDTAVWPTVNNLNLSLQRLITLKINRNNHGTSNVYYRETDGDGRGYAILGNPNLGAVDAIFLGVENANNPAPVCTEVWFNELRLTDISEKGGWAAVGKVETKLADLGTLNVSGSVRTAGFGTIDQSTNERSFDNNAQFDVATNLELGKLLPKKAAVSIPVYAGVTKTTSTPQYDPFDLDIKLSDKLKAAPAAEKDSIREQAVDQTTVQTLNFTNVHKNNTSGKKPKVWSIENFNLSYSYIRSEHHSPVAVEDELITNKGSLGYNYNRAPKFWEPFKRIKNRSPWLSLLRDINLNPLPTTLSFQANVVRQFGAYRSRNIGGPKDILPETYNKFFTFDRLYTLRWDLTKKLALDFTAANKAWVDEDSGRLSRAGRKRMWDNFWRGGRTILYTQTANATYTLPTDKLPILDWTMIKAGYSSSYTWTGASQLATYLGNSIQNTQQRTLLVDLDFTRLYGKWRLLRGLEQSALGPPRGPVPTKDTSHNKKPPTTRPAPELKGVAKGLARLLTSLKHVSLNYSDNSSSTIFGFMDSTRVLGMNLRDNQPGWGYVFGARPDTNFINKLGRKRLLTTDTTFNNQNIITYTQKITATATLEPVRDMHITITLDKTFGKNYSELYKDTTGSSGYVRLNPYVAGTFSVSFISFNTLFTKYKPNELSSTFQKFENYRSIISQRLGNINKYTGGLIGTDGYALGYGKYAQDVLIPAFIAAYTGKSPSKIALINESNGGDVTNNPFSGYLPKPNWNLSYTGLSKLPGFKNVFTNFTITNAYTSTLSMNSFNSQLNYQDPLGYGQPAFIDSISGNLVPYYQVPNITISEQFAPLLDVDMQFVNQMQAKVGFAKSRTLSLSLVDFQLSETRSTEFTIGAGFRKRGVSLPFAVKMPGQSASSKKLQNDLTLRLDFSIRDNATSSSYLDQNASLPTGGQRVVTISPSIDYVLNNRINVKFYFDERRTTPKISTTPPITTVKGGLQIRISLAQ
jgi:cell surface protein SprA